MGTVDIMWEEPPPSALVGNQHGKYVAFAAALRGNVGRWARFPTEPASVKAALNLAQNVRRGKIKGFDTGRYETAVEGKRVWVKCISATGTAGAEPAKKAHATKAKAKAEPPAPPVEPAKPDAQEVRRWATEVGLDVPPRGRLSNEFYELYELEHADAEVAEDRTEEEPKEPTPITSHVSPTVLARLEKRRQAAEREAAAQ